MFKPEERIYQIVYRIILFKNVCSPNISSMTPDQGGQPDAGYNACTIEGFGALSASSKKLRARFFGSYEKAKTLGETAKQRQAAVRPTLIENEREEMEKYRKRYPMNLVMNFINLVIVRRKFTRVREIFLFCN